VTESASLEILRAGAHGLAHDDNLEAALLVLLRSVASQLGVASAAVFAIDPSGGLEIVAAIGLGDPSALAAAVRNPNHPVTRTVAERVAAYDVSPTAAGGPALRSHLPLAVTRDGASRPLGVFAVAHELPTTVEQRAILEAVGDLVSVALERDELEKPRSRG
jgi:GAF domain-containing protein